MNDINVSEIDGDVNMEDVILSLKWNNQKDAFLENLKHLREKSDYTDATLAVDGKFYPVHKLVMRSCSKYFSDLFENTPCKSPVIVLKDVQCHEIEAILDYMYLGKVDVKQKDFESLLKTAKCLGIKDLDVSEYDPKPYNKILSRSSDDACLNNPPSKRRQQQPSDSKIVPPHSSSFVPILQNNDSSSVNTDQTPSVLHFNFKIPSDYTIDSYNTAEDETLDVKVEVEDEPIVEKLEIIDAEDQVEYLSKESNNEGGDSNDEDPGENNGYNQLKKYNSNYDKHVSQMKGKRRVAREEPIICALCKIWISKSRNIKYHLRTKHSSFLYFRAREEGITTDVLYTALNHTYIDLVHSEYSLSAKLIHDYEKDGIAKRVAKMLSAKRILKNQPSVKIIVTTGTK